jgi:hypothetical protein
MEALHGCSPPQYTFVTRDLKFLPKIWKKSMVYGLDPFRDALTHHHCSTLHHNHISWWWLALPIVLRPCREQLSPPLYPHSTFEVKFEGMASISK